MTTRLLKLPLSKQSKNLLRKTFKEELGISKNSTEKKLAEELGLTIKELYPYMLNTYNQIAVTNNELVISERKSINQFKKQITNFIKNPSKPININLLTTKKVGILVDLLSRKVDDKMIKIKIGSINYVVNDNTKTRLLEYINNNFIATSNSSESDQEIIIQLLGSENIELSQFIPTNKLKKSKGAFFKYNIIEGIDTQRYGIFTKNTGDYKDCCFLYALIKAGLQNEKVELLRLELKSRYTPLCDIKAICEKYKININVKQINDKNKNHNYGKEFTEKYELGLIDEHYFIIEPTYYTSYAIKNYKTLSERINWNFIIKANFDKDKKRVVDSFTLIKLLLEHKDIFLTEISSESKFIHSTQYYNKINTEIKNLDFIPDYDITHKNVVPKKKETTKVIVKPTNIFFDFETHIYENDNIHKPYLCRFIDDNNNKQVFYGEKCGLIMLSYLSKKYENVCLIAHNMSYDVRFIIKYLKYVKTMIQKGTKVIACSGKFDKMNITMKDSYLMISMPLRDFSKSFSINGSIKEVISYNMYNQTNCIERRLIPIDEGIMYIKNDNKDVEQFLDNIKKWNLQEGDLYDCIEYSNRYCELDCYILREGYNKFNEFMIKDLKLNINDFLTIASLSHAYNVNSGSYDEVYQISGVPQKFIQKCVVGGRTMVRQNIKVSQNCKTQALDAKSLYPSAMNRMEGFLKGLPSVITDLNYESIKQKDGYFIEIIIKSVGIKRKFPLLSYIDDNGVRQFTNDMIGKTIFIDKYTCEDLIQFQDVTFDVIRGYYFNNGRNNKINKTIEFLYTERSKRKANEDDSEIIFKLCMNSGYGKTIMKDIEDDVKVFTNEAEFNVYLSNNYNWIKEYTHVEDSNKFIAKMFKPTNTHFNIAHVGVEILSMSKRIMNEVMCLAEDNDIDIFYQDTDSMSMRDDDIVKMSELFKLKYDRVLIGENMGQFGFDLKLKDDNDNKCKNVVGVRSLFIAKKCYIVELEGDKKDGTKHNGYYIRMKGVPNSCILYECKKRNLTPFQLYEKLYSGESVGFDLTENGDKDNFKFNKNFSISTIQSGFYTRTLKF